MKKIMTVDCKTKCNFGTISSNVNTISNVIIDGKSAITVQDTKGMAFGMCTSLQNPQVSAANGTPQPCQPRFTSTWSGGVSNCLFNGKKTVASSSRIPCFYGGIITFAQRNSTVIQDNNFANIKSSDTKQGNGSETLTSKEKSTKPIERVGNNVNKEESIVINNTDEESVLRNTIDEGPKDSEQKLCPICNRRIDEKHNSMYYDGKTMNKAPNNPKKLDCKNLPFEGQGSYKTANHHIIPVNEVYNKFSNLVTITTKSGYDINSPENGISLPTPIGANPYRIYEQDGRLITLNFGELEKSERKEIAFKCMRELGLQWHSGGHSYSLGENYLHQSYSKEVTKHINELEADLYHSNLCLEAKDQRQLIVSEMNKISNKIRKKLLSFKKPEESKPFYVSKLAADFAKESRQ